MKVVILCGGRGIRLSNSADFIPKAMVRIGNKPMIWHIMKMYAKFGFNDFVLALGKNGEMIRNYFFNYNLHSNDLSITLDGDSLKIALESKHQENGWKITMIDTGDSAGTGARIFRCKEYLLEENFMVTYSDCVSDIDIRNIIKFHLEHGKIATVSGVMPPFRYGEFILDNDDTPISYNDISKLKSDRGTVNGGFMVFKKEIFNYLNVFDECIIEKEVFSGLVKNDNLRIFKYDGFWQCFDNDREYEYLNNLCINNLQYWLYDK